MRKDGEHEDNINVTKDEYQTNEVNKCDDKAIKFDANKVINIEKKDMIAEMNNEDEICERNSLQDNEQKIYEKEKCAGQRGRDL